MFGYLIRGQFLPAVLANLIDGRLLPGSKDDPCLNRLSLIIVRDAGDSDLQDGRVRRDDLLHFARPDLKPAGFNDILLAVDDEAVELSQLAKSAMKSSSTARSVTGSSSTAASRWIAVIRGIDSTLLLAAYCVAHLSIRSSASSRNRRGRIVTPSPGLHPRGARISGPIGPVPPAASASRSHAARSSGSGHSAAQITARHAASGRRAHQMCSVEMCPCRIDFSRRACVEMREMGRSISIRRLG